ncbi:hypothetical protein [Deinococcus alpinitundrae]|uniref:hypothetical protein n=1 Tax=Deinococcus alpinitundrae TaxID=468913 RepID=UPI00137B2310|nr:hypothetical protein [Deinococcus alpinitundrae]
MHITIHPIVQELRALYGVGERNTLERFWAYTALMSSGTELLPLGDFSPMGQRQPEYLDTLLNVDAEGLAAEYAREIKPGLETVQAEFRLMLVVVDQAGNGWTQRWLTDAAWRFQAEQVPTQPADRRWVTVQLWTHVPFSAGYLRSQVRGAVMRAVWRLKRGLPITLADHLAQEGAALRYGGGLFAGEPLTLEPDELNYTRQVLRPLLGSDHWPTVFTALYGDEAASEVGFPPLGLGKLAGFGLAVWEQVEE